MGDTTNTQILNAIEGFQETIKRQTEAIDALAEDVKSLCIGMAKMETWRNGHEAAHKNEKDRLGKLESRTTLQGVVVGVGEIIIAAIAILGGRN